MFDHLWIYTWTISFCVIPRIIRRKDHLSIDLVDSSCQTDNVFSNLQGCKKESSFHLEKDDFRWEFHFNYLEYELGS